MGRSAPIPEIIGWGGQGEGPVGVTVTVVLSAKKSAREQNGAKLSKEQGFFLVPKTENGSGQACNGYSELGSCMRKKTSDCWMC